MNRGRRTAYSAECSTVEGPPFHGDNEGELRTCARNNVVEFEPVTATLDGRPIALTQVQTALLNFVLPPDNIFGLEAGMTGQSVGDGWVALLRPLKPGSHEIQIFTNGNQLANTTTIKVQPAASRLSNARYRTRRADRAAGNTPRHAFRPSTRRSA